MGPDHFSEPTCSNGGGLSLPRHLQQAPCTCFVDTSALKGSLYRYFKAKYIPSGYMEP